MAGQEYEGRTVVVTGGAQGIGRAIAASFAAQGAEVLIADVDERAGEDAEAELRSVGGRVLFHPTDVADAQSVAAMAQVAEHQWGGIDVLIHNAGIGGGGIHSGDLATWERVLAVNLRGAYLCARAVRTSMARRGGGAIVHIASTRALMSEPDAEPYAASKGGLLALTHALAISLGPEGIRVNAICPGWIDTSAWRRRDQRHAPQLSEADHRQHPVGRVGRPEDVAEACLFLASPRAGFITGQYVVVDGGMTVKMIW